MHGKIIKLWVYLKQYYTVFSCRQGRRFHFILLFFISNFNIQHCRTIASVKFAFTQQLIKCHTSN